MTSPQQVGMHSTGKKQGNVSNVFWALSDWQTCLLIVWLICNAFVDRLMGYPSTQQHAVIGYHGNTCHPDALLLYPTHQQWRHRREWKGGAVARLPFLACRTIFSAELSRTKLDLIVSESILISFLRQTNTMCASKFHVIFLRMPYERQWHFLMTILLSEIAAVRRKIATFCPQLFCATLLCIRKMCRNYSWLRSNVAYVSRDYMNENEWPRMNLSGYFTLRCGFLPAPTNLRFCDLT